MGTRLVAREGTEGGKAWQSVSGVVHGEATPEATAIATVLGGDGIYA